MANHIVGTGRDLSAKKSHTVRDLINYAVKQFAKAQIYFGHGTDNAWDEAVFLILHVLNLPQDSDESVLDIKITQSEKHCILQLIKKRIEQRIPTPYLVHEAWFAGLPFYVDERVLIPRSPLAELINNQFEPWIKYEQIKNILDIGTGCGCIAIACAYNFPDAKIDATDISTKALEVAKINLKKHKKTDQIKLIQTDIFNTLPAKTYDVIVSNPPYVVKAEMCKIPLEYRHEPRAALVAGEDGLVFVERILKDAKKYLAKHGILIVEVGNSAEALIAKYPKLPFIWLEFTCGKSEVFLLSYQDLVSIDY